MSKIIEEYYTKAGITPLLLKQKMVKLSKYPDIAEELEYWITQNKYKEDECVVIEGYSAKKISELSKYMNGEGAFMFLIELRENPQKALKKIKNGFKLK